MHKDKPKREAFFWQTNEHPKGIASDIKEHTKKDSILSKIQVHEQHKNSS